MMRRSLAAIAFLLVVPSAVGCATGSPDHQSARPTTTSATFETGSTGPAACGPTKAFSDEILNFRYSGCWNAVTYSETSSFSSSIVYLSDQPTHQPCHAVAQGTACGWPIHQLAPGHVLLEWSGNSFLGWTLNRVPGSANTIGGQPAHVDVTSPGQCRAIGADKTVSVAIARTVADNWYAMTACLRDPGDTEAVRDVQQMLATVNFIGLA